MPLSKNLNLYQDVRLILDAALRNGGGVYTLATRGAATHWRQRAYYYRTLLHQIEASQSFIPGKVTTTLYDGLKFRQEDNKVLIEPVQVTGTFETLEGLPVDLNHPDEPPTDLEREAEAFAKGLLGDDS